MKNKMFWAMMGLILVITIGLAVGFCINKPTMVTEDCVNTKNGICLDLDSQFCGCNIKEHFCPSREKGLCNLAKCLNEKQITLDYSPTCPHCQRELQELQPFENSINKVDCSKEPCSVEAVPSFVDSKGNVLHAGYLPPEALYEVLCKN